MRKESRLKRIIISIQTKPLLVSFQVLYIIIKNKKTHTNVETIPLPAAVKLCKLMQGVKKDEGLKTVSRSRNREMRHNQCQKASRNNCTPEFGLQTD
jgi:hypothetical protein